MGASIGTRLTRLEEQVDLALDYKPLTVDQYVAMFDAGILTDEDHVELLDGLIVEKDRSKRGDDPMSVGDEHIWCVKKLNKLDHKLEKLGCHMQTQDPVTLSASDSPQPDGVILIGTADDYLKRKAGPSDILCVIEVADSSLHTDRTRKLRLYAEAGLKLYVIINLPDRAIEVYTDPFPGDGRYGTLNTLRAGTLHLPTASGKPLAVPVRSLLP